MYYMNYLYLTAGLHKEKVDDKLQHTQLKINEHLEGQEVAASNNIAHIEVFFILYPLYA